MAETFAQASRQQSYARQLNFMRRASTLGDEAIPQEEDFDEVGQRDFVAEQKAMVDADREERLTQSVASSGSNELAKLLARRALLRVVNALLSASIYLLPVAWLIWTIQFIGGNLLHKKFVPPLEIWEQVIYGVVSFILGTLTIVIVAILAAGIAFSEMSLIEKLKYLGDFNNYFEGLF